MGSTLELARWETARQRARSRRYERCHASETPEQDRLPSKGTTLLIGGFVTARSGKRRRHGLMRWPFCGSDADLGPVLPHNGTTIDRLPTVDVKRGEVGLLSKQW